MREGGSQGSTDFLGLGEATGEATDATGEGVELVEGAASGLRGRAPFTASSAAARNLRTCALVNPT